MSRRLVGALLILVLVLHGVAQASAGMLADPQTTHCDGHETGADDCTCCPDEIPLSGGCAGLCSMMAALLPASSHVAPSRPGEPHWLVSGEAFGPAYVPLKPPPIS